MIISESVDHTRKKSKYKKGLRAICYVSEAALSVATNVFQWIVPAASIFGVPMKYIEDACKKTDLEEEYIDAIDRALDSTYKTFTNSNSKMQILEELSYYTTEMDQGLADVIERTEAYRTTYSTQIDIKEIVIEFERHFKREIAEHPILSNYYIYGTTSDTLDLLKKAFILIESDSKKIDSLYHSTNDIKEDTRKLTRNLDMLKKVVASGTVMFAFFIVASAVLDFHYGFSTLLITYAAIIFSEWLVDFLPFKGNSREAQIKTGIFQIIIVSAIIYLVVSRVRNTGIYEILFVAIGTLIAVALKMWLLRIKEN